MTTIEAKVPDYLAKLAAEVAEREKVALVGPNGAGKSSLLKIIAGVLQADEGSIKLQGEASRDMNCTCVSKPPVGVTR